MEFTNYKRIDRTSNSMDCYIHLLFKKKPNPAQLKNWFEKKKWLEKTKAQPNPTEPTYNTAKSYTR